MTTFARPIAGAQRAVAAIDSCDTPSVKSASPTRMEPRVDLTAPAPPRGRQAQSDFAWVEAAAMAGARMPRG